MAFEPLQSGDLVRPSAFEWNAMLRAGQQAMAGSQGIAPPGQLQLPPPNWIKVKNITGRALRRYCGFRVGPCLWGLEAAPEFATGRDGATLGENVFELSDNEDATNRPVAVLQQPLDVDGIGWAAVSGVTMVKIAATSSSFPSYLPRDYFSLNPRHDAANINNDGTFEPTRLGGELRLLSPPRSQTGGNTQASYALAIFEAGGLRSQAWSAKTGSSLGLGALLGNIVFTTNSELHTGYDESATQPVNTGFTGWEQVTYNTDSQGWQCKRPGIWRVTSTLFTSLAAHTITQLTIGEFGLAVCRNRLGSESRFEHVWQQVTMSGAPVEATQCFVDYLIFAYDDILTVRPRGTSLRVNSVTSSTTNAQTLINMRGFLSAELVTRHWSAVDRNTKVPPPPPP